MDMNSYDKEMGEKNDPQYIALPGSGKNLSWKDTVSKKEN